MALLGTKKLYKGFFSKGSERSQILKNSGYITIILHSVYYNSKGNFWQKIFKGKDTIALTSTITYKGQGQDIEAQTILDKREVKADRNHQLGLSRFLALKIPATADGLELKVNFTATKNDNFENALNLMNSEEFQEPLQLTPISVGQIVSITNVIKKIFTGLEDPAILDSTYAGIISQDKVTSPIESERLTEGYLIMIANNDEDSDFLSHIKEEQLTIEGDGLKHNGQLVTHTNLVFSIIFEDKKGVSENSNWFKKYRAAINKLDDIVILETEPEKEKVLMESKKLWMQGNTLLFDDATYIDKEKRSIKASYLNKIEERYTELTKISDKEFANKFLDLDLDGIDFIPSIQNLSQEDIITKTKEISSDYLKELGKMNKTLPL